MPRTTTSDGRGQTVVANTSDDIEDKPARGDENSDEEAPLPYVGEGDLEVAPDLEAHPEVTVLTLEAGKTMVVIEDKAVVGDEKQHQLQHLQDHQLLLGQQIT